jgi:phosphoesterase RecJ-like protein
MKTDVKFQTKVDSKFKSDFDSEVKKSKSIVITAHKSADDDSISSVLAVYYYIINYLKIDSSLVNIFYTGDKDDKWESFENYDKIKFVYDVTDEISTTDLIIILDCQGWARFSKSDKEVNFKGRSILIDHHPIPLNQFDLQLVANNYSSTAEIVYDLLYRENKLSTPICEILLLGILGDTGNFEFIDYKNAGVLVVAQRLIEEGKINVQTFVSRYQKVSERVYLLLIELMKNSEVREVKNWPKFVISNVDIKICAEHKYSDNEISEASSLFTKYLRAIKGVDWGMIITPRLYDKTHSVSFRSSPGSVVTREIGEKMGIGGGHDRASGGKLVTSDTDEAVKIILNWMEENKPSFS